MLRTQLDREDEKLQIFPLRRRKATFRIALKKEQKRRLADPSFTDDSNMLWIAKFGLAQAPNHIVNLFGTTAEHTRSD
jgi:hypothetical protein